MGETLDDTNWPQFSAFPPTESLPDAGTCLQIAWDLLGELLDPFLLSLFFHALLFTLESKHKFCERFGAEKPKPTRNFFPRGILTPAALRPPSYCRY